VVDALRPDVTLISPFPRAGAVHEGFSGVASYTANLANALVDRGATVHVVADHLDEPTGDGAHVEGGASVSHRAGLTVTRAFRRGPRALLDAARAALDVGAPVTHLQLEMFLYGGPAALASLPIALGRLRRGGQGPVVTLHQVLDPATIDRHTVAMHRVNAPAPVARAGVAGLHQVVGRLAAATVVHEGPFAELVPDAVVIPHGMERRERPDRFAARQLLGIDHDRLTIVCFGFLAPYKGLELVLEAGELTADVAQVVVAGGEHPRLAGRDRYADELRDRHAHHARFTGWVPEAHVGPWFAAADLAAYPYPRPFAASGSVSLALAHRTPVLLSPGLARFMGAPSDVVMPTRPEALADKIRGVAAERQQLDSLACWSNALASGRAWPEVADRHVSLYQEVSHGPDPSRRRLRAAQPG
jgi:glycosyltransferase involved in cell wall biosynthesis